jgi:hypothetical protein
VDLGPLDVPGALRFDRARSWFPEATIGPVPFLPTTTTTRNERRRQLQGSHAKGRRRMGTLLDWKDVPKINIGRYMEAAQNANNYIDTGRPVVSAR